MNILVYNVTGDMLHSKGGIDGMKSVGCIKLDIALVFHVPDMANRVVGDRVGPGYFS